MRTTAETRTPGIRLQEIRVPIGQAVVSRRRRRTRLVLALLTADRVELGLAIDEEQRRGRAAAGSALEPPAIDRRAVVLRRVQQPERDRAAVAVGALGDER